MQLKRLYIKDYKILKDFTLEFPHDFKRYITILIGDNGSGKSTVLEVMAQIFSDAIRDDKAKFAFELEYSLKIEEVLEETSTTSESSTAYFDVSLSAKKAGEQLHVIVGKKSSPLYSGGLSSKLPISLAIGHRLRIKDFTSVVPDSVVVYYSGLSETMAAITDPHNQDLSRYYRNGRPDLHPFFFYFQPKHFGVILLSLLSYEFGDIPEFLRDKAKITGLQSVTIRLKKPIWASDTVKEFWGAKGKVRAFLDYLDHTSEPLLYDHPHASKRPGNIVIESTSGDHIVITIVTQERLFEIRDYVQEERLLFEILNMLLLDGMLDDVSFSLKRDGNSDGPNFHTLSEGEQQTIIIKGLTELLSGKNSLFLFDEPDTFLHPKWQREFISGIESSINQPLEEKNSFLFPENTFLIATHSPQILSKAKNDTSYVKIMDAGKTVKNTPKHYGRDIATVLFEMMGVSNRPKEIREKLNLLSRLIDGGNYDEADQLFTSLENILGYDDPDLVDARALKELLTRKLK